MSNLVEQFEGLLKQMEDALITNDIDKIRSLTEQQQTCLGQVVQGAKKNPLVKRALEREMPAIVRQMRTNEMLLNQAMTLSTSIVRALHSSISSHMPRQTNSRVYTA
jgi:hypothetical protein